MAEVSKKAKEIIDITLASCARNYIPIDVVFAEGKGSWLIDVDGNKYLDMLSAYSAINFGHCNPRIEAAAVTQLKKLTLTSRAFYNDQLGPMCKELAALSGMEAVLPMNTGAEAVETAVKAARKWGYDKKKVRENSAEIICFNNNFHGRTTTVVSFSDSPSSRSGFGPLTPGFKLVPYGEIQAIKDAITENTVAVLIEPIQGEGGVVIPPKGYIKQLRELCSQSNILMIADEIQTGLCRTGEIFACDHEEIKPDIYIVGKSLGGGVVPISAIISRWDIIEVLSAGTHGSTFGGNPFACAIAREVIKLIQDEKPHKLAKEKGEYFVESLMAIKSKYIKDIRAKGLMCGLELAKEFGTAKDFCKKLLAQGVVAYHTREQTVRLAPPLFISKEELDFGIQKIKAALL